MKAPIFVRPFSKKERKQLEAGLRSKDTFTLRRSQMLLTSSRGNEIPQIAENLGSGQQTVRNAVQHPVGGYDGLGRGVLGDDAADVPVVAGEVAAGDLKPDAVAGKEHVGGDRQVECDL